MRKKLSKTPRSARYSRKVQFSIAMREHLSKKWVKERRKRHKKTKKP